jgi:hypothetical protein
MILNCCAICKTSFAVDGKIVELKNSRQVCGGCAEYSGAALRCDGCGEVFFAADLVRDDEEALTLCCDCIRENIVEKYDFFTWADWEEASDDDDPATVEGFILWHVEAWEYWPRDHPYRRQLAKMIETEIESEARAEHRILLDDLAGSGFDVELSGCLLNMLNAS